MLFQINVKRSCWLRSMFLSYIVTPPLSWVIRPIFISVWLSKVLLIEMNTFISIKSIAEKRGFDKGSRILTTQLLGVYGIS